MEKFEQYRSDLAERIKEAPKEERKNILEEAQKTDEYLEAREEKKRAAAVRVKRIQEIKTELKENDDNARKNENAAKLEKIEPNDERTWK
ncbi:MAG: hypothetical protein KGJ35_03040, partial [Patescibacteria group bacterium]|nr:hypothetical protein [Patescibacteria group bacterium]